MLLSLITQTIKANDLPIAMLGGKDFITVPFQFLNGYIVVEAEFNDVISLNCIFDTGAEHSLLFNPILANILALSFTDTVKVYGTDFVNYRHAYITRDSKLKVGTGKTIDHDLLFVDGDIYNFEQIVGRQIDGILGLSLFGNLGISINYVKRKIHIFNPKVVAKFVKKGFKEEPITVHNHKPYLTIFNAADEEEIMLLDSGANLSMLEYIDNESDITSNYINGILGRGLGGDILGYAGMSSRKTLMGQQYESIIVNYQIKSALLDSFFINTDWDRNGLIGNHVLKQFDLVFNMLTETLYTRPNKLFTRQAVYNKSGIEVVAFGKDFNQFFVHSIIEQSPALSADIRRGDILLSINKLPMFFWNINTINRLFSSKKDKSIKVKLNRDGTVIERRIRLESYLE